MRYLDTKLNSVQYSKSKNSRTKFPSPNYQTEFLSPHGSHPNFKENLIRKRAFKTNSRNLSFKGSFFRVLSGYSEPIKGYKTILDKADKIMSNVPSDMIKRIQKLHPNAIVEKDGEIKFRETGILRRLFDAAIYPVRQLPLDLADFSIRGLRKLPFLKNSKTLDRIYNTGFLAKNREKIFLSEQVEALSKLLKNSKKLDFSNSENKEAFLKQVHSLFDPKKGNYNTAHERALNRLVSGIIPAFFLANDAYNLSRYCDDNKDAANKEYKVRFNQEVARIGAAAYLQLVVLGGLSKVINSSLWGAVLSTTGITVFTELFSRKLNGKPVWLLNKEDAKEQYKKEYGDFSKEQKDKGIDYQYFNMPVAFKKNKTFASFAQNEQHAVKQDEQKKAKQKPLVTLKGLLQYSLWSTVAGFTLLALRKNSKTVNELFVNATKPFNEQYKKLAFKDLEISKKDLSYLAERFEKAGYTDIADGYKKLISNSKNDMIKFGTQATKKKPVVDFVIGPFKFVWKTLTFPYSISKKVLSLPIKTLRSEGKAPPNTNQILGDGIQYIMDNTNKLTDAQFKEFVDKKILSSFNKTGKSNYSNADLAIITKLFCSTATSFFLIADHYNMVMTKSKGEDKKGAALKAKERIAQRVSSIFYSTLFIDLFNNTFKRAYHASLFGMSAVTAACTIISEQFTRISIGMPVHRKSKAEMVELEMKNNSRDGLLGQYFRFMSRLTGKKVFYNQNNSIINNQSK